MTATPKQEHSAPPLSVESEEVVHEVAREREDDVGAKQGRRSSLRRVTWTAHRKLWQRLDDSAVEPLRCRLT